MFRSKRTTLVKRLLKLKTYNENGGKDETPQSPVSSEEVEMKSSAQSILKRLKDKTLETLLCAVESKGGEKTGCVLLPKGDIRLGKRTVSRLVLILQLWRWPEITEEELKKLPFCSEDDNLSVCCNPYHWAKKTPPDSPPPSYNTCMESSDNKVINEDKQLPQSTETGGTPSLLRVSDMSYESGWCCLAYWELRERVGRLFSVTENTVNIFNVLPQGDGMCLSVLQPPKAPDIVKRTREKIGFGMTLSKEPDGIWLYNRSEYPIFVNSPTLEVPNSRTVVVKKVSPGYCLKIFDFQISQLFQKIQDPKLLDGPYDPNSIRISFAKGWGPSYSRLFTTSCPCWLEVLLRVDR